MACRRSGVRTERTKAVTSGDPLPRSLSPVPVMLEATPRTTAWSRVSHHSGVVRSDLTMGRSPNVTLGAVLDAFAVLLSAKLLAMDRR